MNKVIPILVFITFALVLSGCSGTATTQMQEDSPTGAYQRLFAAVKRKDIDDIKSIVSAKTLEFAKMAAAQQNKPIEKVLENGFTATTFAESLPQIRDQRIDGDMGAVEVYNSKDKMWEDLPFVREANVRFQTSGDTKASALEAIKPLRTLKVNDSGNSLEAEGAILVSEADKLRRTLAEVGVNVQVVVGGWKLAIGDIFADTWKSPGKGLAQKEREAANVAGNNMIPLDPNVNGNFNTAPRPKPIIPKPAANMSTNMNK